MLLLRIQGWRFTLSNAVWVTHKRKIELKKPFSCSIPLVLLAAVFVLSHNAVLQETLAQTTFLFQFQLLTVTVPLSGTVSCENYPFTCHQIITYMYILPHHVQSWVVFYEAIFFCFVTYISFCCQWNSFEIAAIWWPSLLHLACYICFVTFNSCNCFICLWALK